MIKRVKQWTLLQKIVCIFILFAIVTISIWGGTLLSNKYSVANRKLGLTQVNWASSAVEKINWDGSESDLISSVDPMLFLDTGETYVAQICVIGVMSDAKGTPRIYYTEKKGDDFSEERSFLPEVEREGNRTYLTVDRTVERLRIDLTETAGMRLELKQIMINQTDYSITIKSMLYAGLLAVCLLTVCAVVYFSVLLFLGDDRAYLDTFLKYRHLLWNLVSRDVKVKYRRSVLGIVWSVLNPLLMMLVITAVFENLFRYDIEYFPVYYLTGSLLFNFVTDATGNAMISILYAAPLIKKVHVPKYIFPLEKCLFALVNMLFSSVATILVLVILRFEVSWTALLFPIPMLCIFLFAIGIGMILATSNVFFRDTGHLYGVWTTAWFYLTPVIYPVDILPAVVATFVKLNPLYYYIEYFRQVVMYGTVPDFYVTMICVGSALFFLLLGLFLFKQKQDRFILFV